MTYEAHEAGRELDALISEDVLGIPCFYHDESENYIGEHSDMPIPHYSTDIAAAWEVWEHLVGHGWTIGLEYMKTAQGMQYRCDLHATKTGDVVDVFAPEAPLAICLAALKAVGA